MTDKDCKIAIRVDAYTRVCLTVIAVLLTVVIVGLWADAMPGPDRASAQGGSKPPKLFVDSAAQRRAAVEAQNQTTEKVTELVRLLTTGQAKVQVVDEKTVSSERSNVRLQVQKTR